MKLSQKNNCNRCSGGYFESNPFIQICDLGFKVAGSRGTGIPEEPCYKPLTNKEYIEARKLIRI